MNKPLHYFSGTDKVAILKRHLVDKVPIAHLCDELDLHTNQIHGWLKDFFDNGHAAFDNVRGLKAVEDRKSQPFEAKLARKHEVMAKVIEPHTEPTMLPEEQARAIAYLRSRKWSVECEGDNLTARHSFGALSEDCFEALSQLQNLTSLDLNTAAIQDAQLVHINGLTNLRTLNLRGTRISDEAIEYMCGLSELQILWLNYNPIKGHGLRHIAHLPRLQQLFLDETGLVDEAMEYLKSFQALEYLTLTSTKVTDAGVAKLGELSSLSFLDVANTAVTEAALAQIETRLPHITIDREWY